MKIIADFREKNSFVIAELTKAGVEVEIKHLAVADYLLNDIAIERKTASDFVSSMINKRLIRQLEELKQYPKQLLIIEGLEESTFNETKLHPNAIRGMILSTLLDFSVPIVFTKDAEDTATYLLLLAKKQEKGTTEINLKAKKKAYSLAEQQQIILEGFPGIGPATAKKLLEKFKTIKNIINATDEKLEGIKKLNKKKIFVMKKIINAKYSG